MTTLSLLGGFAAALVAFSCESVPEDSKPSAIRDGIAEVNGTKLAWKSYGSGDRTIVFVQGAQLGPRLDDLICAGQPALESNLLAAPITLIDSVQVDAAAHDGTGGVKCLGWDRVR